MKKILLILGIIVIILAGGAFLFAKRAEKEPVVTIGGNVAKIEFISPAFSDQQNIPVKYTCNGEGMTPPLAWDKIPQTTKSVVVTVRDPDVPVVPFTHWLIYNIDPSIHQFAEGQIPDGAQLGLNTMNKKAYLPLCPPNGTHHYVFRVYALDEMLPVADMDNAGLADKIAGHVVGYGGFTSQYGK